MDHQMSGTSSKPVALVTGASAGIGAVYAERLAARGYDLVLVARRAERLEALSARVAKAYGTKVLVIGADLTKEAALARVKTVLATDPAVRILVNNAGKSTLAPVAQTSAEDAAAM